MIMLSLPSSVIVISQCYLPLDSSKTLIVHISSSIIFSIETLIIQKFEVVIHIGYKVVFSIGIPNVHLTDLLSTCFPILFFSVKMNTTKLSRLIGLTTHFLDPYITSCYIKH